jgi:cytosine/adenosine deaminase-related metal-dependent hydrolase
MIINAALLAGEDLTHIEEGHLIIENGLILEAGDGFLAGGLDLRSCLAMPSLMNAHTHVGDSFAKEAAWGCSVKEAVGKKGLKWRLYEESTKEERIAAMKSSLTQMLVSGTTCFADFREFGWEGIEELEMALDEVPLKAIILGRDVDISEVDGLGLNLYQVDQIPEDRKNKMIVLHAGEVRGEVEKALEYKPDVLVHCTHATKDDLKAIRKKKIPVVVCPRSNAVLGVGFPDVSGMLELGVCVCLGTDNVLTNSPDLWREMEFLSKVSCLKNRLEPLEVLKMATVNASKAFRRNCGAISKGNAADILFMNMDSMNLSGSRDIVSSLVNRCGPEDIAEVMLDGRFVFERR